MPNPVTVDVAEAGLVILAEPLIKVHTPVPEVGTFPANAADEAHTV